MVLKEKVDSSSRDFGEYILYKGLPREYKVYLFYYRGRFDNSSLERELRALGEDTGRNLFVNFGKINDPDYPKLAGKFEISKTPVLIMTANEELATIEDEDEIATAYIRIDKERLFKDPVKCIDLVDRLYNLFVSGNLHEAKSEAKRYQRNLTLLRIKEIVNKGLKEVLRRIDERDIITISVAPLKIEMIRSGGHNSGRI